MDKLRLNGELINAFIESPENEKGSGVLVLHAWWGLTDVIHQFCKRLATEGYFVIAPDLYNGNIAITITQAEEYSDQMDNT